MSTQAMDGPHCPLCYQPWISLFPRLSSVSHTHYLQHLKQCSKEQALAPATVIHRLRQPAEHTGRYPSYRPHSKPARKARRPPSGLKDDVQASVTVFQSATHPTETAAQVESTGDWNADDQDFIQTPSERAGIVTGSRLRMVKFSSRKDRRRQDRADEDLTLALAISTSMKSRSAIFVAKKHAPISSSIQPVPQAHQCIRERFGILLLQTLDESNVLERMSPAMRPEAVHTPFWNITSSHTLACLSVLGMDLIRLEMDVKSVTSADPVDVGVDCSPPIPDSSCTYLDLLALGATQTD